MSELTNALITYDDVIAKTNIDVLRKIAKVHGFVIFDKGNYNLNIWGIRCNTADTGTFNDLLLVFYKANDADPKINGKWTYDWFSITTDPSDLNLIKPINSKGCAILKEGQFRNAFKIGKHKGDYFVVDTNVSKNNLSLPEYGLLAIVKSATKRYKNYKFNKNK